MKMAGIREIRAQTAAFLGSEDPVLVTRYGRVSGVYIPLDRPDELPGDLAREVARNLGAYLSRSLEARSVTEEDVLKDFDAHRRRRR
jgi:hypothetical protein